MSKELKDIIEDLTQNKLTRRQFITRAAALGLSMGAIGSILAACGGGTATPAATETATAAATETATAAATETATATTAATETATATATATQAATTGGDLASTIIIASSGDLANWDPAQSIFWLANEVIQNTHDVLLDYETSQNPDGLTIADPAKLRPEMANFDFAQDGKTLTFTLKDGIKFQNGDPMNAEAVKANFERFLQIPGTAQFLIKDMGLIADPSQMEVVDDKTLKMTTPKPSPLLPKIMPLLNMAIVNVNEMKKSAPSSDPNALEWAKTHTTGSGAYMIDKFEPGTQLVLKSNPNYWKGKPKTDTVLYKVVPTPEDRLLLLQNGDVDIVYEVPLKDVGTLKSSSDLNVISVHTVGNTNVIMDNTKAPFDNVKVRQAISYAVNYDRIIKDANYGLAAPLTSSVPKGVEYHVDNSLPYKYDPEKAKSLLADAGYPDAKGLPQLTFSLKMGVPEEEATAVYIQDDLKQVGIDMQINKMTMAAHSDALQKKELAFTFNYFIPYVPDPVYHLYWNYNPDSPINYSKYNNPTVTKMIDDASVEVDQAKKQSMVEEIQKLIAPDAPMLYLYQPTWNLAISSKLKGYIYYPGHLTWFQYMSKS